MDVLNVENLTKRFGGLVAVNNVSFNVKKGELLGLIGPNGSGKTTVFNLISGVYRPDAGTILYNGINLLKIKPCEICDLGVTRTFQIVKPFSNLNVLKNVMVGSFVRTHSFKTAEKEAIEILKYTGLYKKKNLLARSLTIADRKRLELARALATKPELLLLDEIVAGLNPTETFETTELIKDINEHGITIVMVEHVMKAVMILSERIIVLHHGVKIAEGPPREIASDKRVIEVYLGEEYML